MKKPRDLAAIAALVLAPTIWGASFVLAKLALEELAVAHVVLYRFLFSAGPLVPILLASRVRPSRRDLPLFALTGFLMVPVTFFLQFGGLTFTSATSAALMVGTGTPLFAVAAVLFEGERLGRRGWTAVAVSSLGVLVLVGFPGEGNDWRGNLLMFVSLVISTVWVLMSKRLIARYPAFHVTGWILVFGTLFLIPASLAWEGVPTTSLSGAAWGSLLGLGLGCTILAYVLWNWGLGRLGAGPAGIFLNLEPAAGALLGIVVLGDPLTIGVVGGGALILAATGMISAGERSAEVPGARSDGSEVRHRICQSVELGLDPQTSP